MGSLEKIKLDLKEYIRNLNLYTPAEINKKLESLGYRGQENARKAMALMAYRHLKRLKLIYIHGIPPEKLPPKSNYLMIGPTGCGKTFIVELLFKEIIPLPTVIVDITSFSETGYVGDNVETILTRLIYAAKGNVLLASCGIVCLDEFDKIASESSTIKFEGARTTKDVTGRGVQRELLKLLESKEVVVSSDYDGYLEKKIAFPTSNVTFLACGTFSGFKFAVKDKDVNIGFTRSHKKKEEKDKIAVKYTEDEIENIENFQNYGFMPELIGRFSRIVIFEPLDKKTLKEILYSNVIKKFKSEFESENIKLTIDDSVLNFIVSESIKKQTGARGITASLTKYLEDAGYYSFSNKKIKEVKLTLHKGKIKVKYNY